MKRQLLVAAMIMISAISLGQKKELKKAEKAIKDGEFSEALTLLNTAEGLISGADDETKSLLSLLKGKALLGNANGDFNKMKMASESISKAIEGGNKDAIAVAQEIRIQLINSAVKDQNAENFGLASEKLYTSYQMTKNDTTDLYYAASAALNAKDFDKAIDYYQKLVDLGFTDIKTEYVATEKASGEEKKFSSKSERDLFIKSGEYIKPEIKKTTSKKGEILRNLAVILIDQDKKEQAVKILSNAKKENPNDIELLKVDANLAYQMGDIDRYNNLMQEVVKSDPNNPELYFNLGVVASNNEQNLKAIEYYEKAIEINPNYTNALINLGVLKLSKEKEIVDEMNGLGTSRADNERYELLKEKRKQMYMKALPYLERAISSNPDGNNEELMKTLMNIYSQIGEDAKFKAMKSKVDALGN